jgi:hypothetical protein
VPKADDPMNDERDEVKFVLGVLHPTTVAKLPAPIGFAETECLVNRVLICSCGWHRWMLPGAASEHLREQHINELARRIFGDLNVPLHREDD